MVNFFLILCFKIVSTKTKLALYRGGINGLISNHKQCEAMLIGCKHAVKNARPLCIVLDGKPMRQSDYFKYLGTYIDHCLTWSKGVKYIKSRVYPKLKLLHRISSFLSRDIFLRIYKQTVLPLLDCGCVV